ncbi:toll/interleukin-1 receptor domain-containing protein [Streptomyces fuscichromogenes]|uniref:toll/interleukin-1 receptor domain-containing protein n=1 Tax=Streptomyces fuscichromogenes TaxID=1324013 RepID=UPI001E64ACB0|nr:toll/interleukin-1 receptor domain-containing protein [Streptomyces fuscichromogenes]
MADGSVFVSYAGPDRVWAEWVAWHLRDAGRAVVLDVWDWSAGDNFVARMDEALNGADAVVALFSRHYFDASRWTRQEWASVVARRERLVPLVIEPLDDTEVPALLAPLIRRNLHGLDEQQARAALLDAVAGARGPRTRPAFPGDPAAPPPGVPDRRPPLPVPGPRTGAASSTGQGLPGPDTWRPPEPPLFSSPEERARARDVARAPRRPDIP